MDIDLAKKNLKSYLNWEEIHGFSKGPNDLAIEAILSELEKKDKIIDKLAFALADYVMYYEYDKCRNPEMIKNKAKEKIEYFTNKVEEDIKE